MLLVEVFNEKQAEVFLKAKFLTSCLEYVERQMSLYSTWGVIPADILDGMSDEQIQICLAHQLVSKAYRLIRRRDGKPFPL
jgi:hypothetical protein